MNLVSKHIIIGCLSIILILVAESEGRGSSKDGYAQARIQIFEERLILLKKDIGRYPSIEEGLNALIIPPPGSTSWTGPYVPYGEIPIDPWGRPYIYIYPAKYGNRDFDLYSLGQNGIHEKGEGDDITNWHGYSLWQYHKGAFIREYLIYAIFVAVMFLVGRHLIKKRRTAN